MRIVFMGTPQAAVPSLERCIADGHEIAAVYTQPDRPSGRGNKVVYSPIKSLALEHGIEIRQPPKIKTREALAEFQALAAGVAVVVAYGRILPAGFLTAFPLGAINLHFSLLPKYRGAAPVNWAIVNGETETGVTTMQMDEGLDTGPILLQESSPIDSDDTSVELMNGLAVMGADLLSKTLTNVSMLVAKRQDDSAATLAPIMRRTDGMIDWDENAADIRNRVRGFQPFPGTYSFLEGRKLSIWRASAEDTSLSAERPGTVTIIETGEIGVACGGGSLLRITEVQPEGKRRMSVRDFLNGTDLRPGSQFTNGGPDERKN